MSPKAAAAAAAAAGLPQHFNCPCSPSPPYASSLPPLAIHCSLLNECHAQLLYNELLSQWVTDSDSLIVVAVLVVAVIVVVLFVVVVAIVIAAENQFRVWFGLIITALISIEPSNLTIN